MRIAVDTMGAEKGIGIVIKGSLGAIKENPQIQVSLVGDEKKIKEEIGKLGLENVPFSIVHASQIIEMDDSPIASLKSKKNSSISIALDLLKDGGADALVSAGNTGAVMTLSLLKLGRAKGVKRPCLAAIFPTIDGGRVILLDVGANIDCKPYHLFQFAIMGSIYAYKILKKRTPRVGLLNIGTEENKGNKLTLEAFKLLKHSSLNFVGNIESRDITSGKVEVVVCDGFIGNVILKFAESFARATLSVVDIGAKRTLFGLGRIITRGWRGYLKRNLDYAEYGGVPLLGVNGVCMIAHGASSSKAIKNAILASFKFAKAEINPHIEKALMKSGVVKGEIKRDSDSRNGVLYPPKSLNQR
ncbi:MAG: phosphate acyltransferase PlsX [Candidatus Aerophobetes bacterium]|nr:phosphate acyltransferase PlsX [Candidatus Aerophobetes bacterium]